VHRVPKRPELQSSVALVGEPWKESAYYEEAERWTFIFWEPAHPFRPWFDRLDLHNTLELACGYGRHAERAAPLAGTLTLMDIHAANLEACRLRLAHYDNVGYILNNGYDFSPVPDNSLTAIFCYDAMVHFSPDLVASYLHDARRVLAPGGMALLHHSNFDATEPQHYGLNPQARNRMTMSMFRGLAEDAGLEVVDAKTLDWAGVAELDGLTLLRSP
jgi:SAM-dependent methyltransferase